MAGNRKFHNKFHSANHHTLPSPHIIDSGLDPVASHEFPFIGDFVLNGVLSSSNNYELNYKSPFSDNLDNGIAHGTLAPSGWNIFRNSTLIDGDMTITGNLTALGELTYLHTQVHAKSATEIEVLADNTNGKTAALTVDQHGTNDIVHFKNDGISTLLITGSADNNNQLGGWFGINLGNLPDVSVPNQRMTIVGSVSVVPDPNEVADQHIQEDPGTSGSLYVEGGLHVNDHTFLDQVTIDTTDGVFYVSGGNNDATANKFTVDVPTELDKLTVDTTDGDFYVHGGNKLFLDADKGLEVDTHSHLDQVTIDTTDGDFLVSGSNSFVVSAGGGFSVDTHTDLDSLHVVTDDGQMRVSGLNQLYIGVDSGVDIDTFVDIDGHTQLDQVTIDTGDGETRIIGPGGINIDTFVDIDLHTQLDQVTVDTTDGEMRIIGTGGLNVDTDVDMSRHTRIDQLSVDTTDGEMLVNGPSGINVDTFVDIDGHTQLDQVTVDTTDGEMRIMGPGGLNVDTDVDMSRHTRIDQLSVDTTDGDFVVEGEGKLIVQPVSGMEIHTDVDVTGHSTLDQVTIDTDGGEARITGTGGLNVDTDVDMSRHTRIDQLSVDTTDGDFVVDGEGVLNVQSDTELDRVTIDTDGGETRITGTGGLNVDTDVDMSRHTKIDQLTVDTTDGDFVVEGEGVLNVSVPTDLNQVTVDTTNGPMLIAGANILDVNTDADFKGGTLTSSRTNIETSAGNDLHVTGGGMMQVDAEASFSLPVETSKLTVDTTYGQMLITNGLSWESRWGFNVHVPTFLASLTASTNNDPALFFGTNATIFETPVQFTNVQPIEFLNVDISRDLNVGGDLHVEGLTRLDTTVIDTNEGEFVVSGSNKTVIETQTTIDNNLHVTGELRVDGNAYLNADASGTIYVGDSDQDNVVFNSDVASDIVPDSDKVFNIGSTDNKWDFLHSHNVLTTNISTVNMSIDFLNVNQDLGVGGDTTLSGDVDVAGLMSVDNDLVVQQGVTGGNLHIFNDSVLEGGLDVDLDVEFKQSLTVQGDLYVRGDTFLSAGDDGVVHVGDQNTDSVTIHADISSDLIPDGTRTYNLGSEARQWLDVRSQFVYVSDRLTTQSLLTYGDSVFVGDVEMSGHTELDQTTINTTEGELLIIGPNDINIDTSVDIDGHTQLDQVTIDTTDGGMTVSGTNDINIDTSVDIDGHTQLDQVTIDTTDGVMTVSGSNKTNIHTDLVITKSVSAVNGPWYFTGCDDMGYSSGSINDPLNPDAPVENIDQSITIPEHPFKVDCRALFTTGLTANGPVQIGNLPEQTVEGLDEPTFEVLGNAHVRDGNLKIVSDLRHLDDEDTLMRFTPDAISFIAGGSNMLSLVENSDVTGNDLVKLGDEDSASDVKMYKQSGETGFDFDSTDGSLDISGDVVVQGSLSATDDGASVNIRNLVVDYLTVHKGSFGHMDGTGGTTGMSVLSGIATKDNITTEYVNGYTQSFTGTEVGITYDVTQDDAQELQNFFTFTFEALEDNADLGVVAGDTQTVNYHFVAKWDEFYTQAFVNETESGIVFTSDDTFANVTSVVLSANDVPTTERIVKIVIQPEVDVKYWTRNVLVQDKPRVLDTVTTGDFTVEGDLTIDSDLVTTNTSVELLSVDRIDTHIVPSGDQSIGTPDVPWSESYIATGIFGSVSAIQDVVIDGDTHIKGNLRVDGTAFLSAGDGGEIRVGDTSSDTINFIGDVASDLIPSSNMTYDLGTAQDHWMYVYTHHVSAHGDVFWSGGSSILADSVYSSVLETSANWGSTHASVLDTSANWDSTHTSVLDTSANWDSTHASVLDTSASWNSVYNTVQSDSATNNTDYNRTTFVNASGDTIAGDLNITGHLSGETAVFTSITALSSVVDVIDIKVRELSGYDIIDGDLTVNGDISASGDIFLDKNSLIFSDDETFTSVDSFNSKSVYNSVLDTSANWDSTHASVLETSANWDSTQTSVYNTSANWDSTHASVLDTSANWDSAHASVLDTSANWDSTHLSVLDTSANWDSTHASVLDTSANWDSAHTSVLETSSNWDSTHASVLDTSAKWDSTHASVLDTSANWDSTHASVLDTSANWDSTHASVLDTSANWDSTHASVLETSANWDSVYSYINTTSGDVGFAHLSANGDGDLVLRDDQVPNLAITNVYRVENSSLVSTLSGKIYRGDIVLVNSTEENLIATTSHPEGTYFDSIGSYIGYEKLFAPGNIVRFINGHQGQSVILDADDLADDVTDHKFVDQTEIDKLHSVYDDVNAVSGQWNAAYSFVHADSATNNTDYNRTTFVNTSGDTITGKIEIENDLTVTGLVSGDTAIFTSITALSSYVDVIDIKVRELSGYDIIDGNLIVDGNITLIDETLTKPDLLNFKSTYASVLDTSANWDSTHTSVYNTSANWDSTHASVLATSANWDSTHASVLETSANWDSTHASVFDTSANWDSTHASVLTTSSNWDSTHASVLNTSGNWNSVYSFVKTTSGSGDGYAILDGDGKLLESQIPNLSICEIYTVSDPLAVKQLCNGSTSYGDVNIERGDVVIVTSPPHTLIAAVDGPDGKWTDNSGNPGNTDTFDGFVKLATPTDYVFSVNGKNGYQIVLNPDDMDDASTSHKFVDQVDIDTWNSTHASVVTTSSNWDSTHASVLSTSSNWDSTHASVLDTSANWDSTHASVLDTSASWDSTHASVLSTSSNWDSTHASVLDTSANWDSTHASVLDTSASWNSVYNTVHADSATNNTDYNRTTFVNVTGDLIDGNLDITGSVSISGDTTIDQSLTVSNSASFEHDVKIKGDLYVDGNAYLSGGTGGVINVGDMNTDVVVFGADIDSDIVPDKNMSYDLGTQESHWMNIYTHNLSAHENMYTHNLTAHGTIDVTGTFTLSGKNSDGPGVVVKGTPTGIFDENAVGFIDRDGDYMRPDVDITGDVALHGSLSADEAHIHSLTASNFRAEYQKLVVNDGDLEMHNGSFKQRGGNVLIDGDIGHIDDENTYVRFAPDSIRFVCHDVRMIQLNENPVETDQIVFGDLGDAVNLRVQNPIDEYTFYVDAESGRIGVGTSTPQDKLHVIGGLIAETGQVQFADSDGVTVTVGDSQSRLNKPGSIRWNTELERYEGYNAAYDLWMSLTTIGDTDGDTYISVDAEESSHTDSDCLSLFTAGCSAMVAYPDQTVAFAGDIRFDNITVFDESATTGPLSATSEFIYLTVNGKQRAIRLWDTPVNTRGDLHTIRGEHIINIGQDCVLGTHGDTPMQTISANDVLSTPPTQGVDTDQDGVSDVLDTDDDGDDIPDEQDADHFVNVDEPDTDGDGIIDKFDISELVRTGEWDQGYDTQWNNLTNTWDQLSGEE